MSRTLENIISSFRETLNSIASPLANFANYSNTYALARSFAYALIVKEGDIEDIRRSMFISSASSEDLDKRGIELGINRRLGNKALGTVLITSNNTSNIPLGTLLSTADGSLQYNTITSITSNTKVVNIQAVKSGSIYNLPAGTQLYSSIYPNLIFNVGISINNETVFTGDIYGGTDIENDSTYRKRILDSIKGRHYGTYTSLLSSVREVAPFNKIQILDNTPSNGVITIYIDTNNINIIRAIENKVEEVKPMGVAYIIQSLNYNYIDFSINTQINIGFDLDETLAKIRSVIANELDKVPIGGRVSIVNILAVLKTIEGLTSINILNPNPARVIQLSPNSVPISNNIVITVTQ